MLYWYYIVLLTSWKLLRRLMRKFVGLLDCYYATLKCTTLFQASISIIYFKYLNEHRQSSAEFWHHHNCQNLMILILHSPDFENREQTKFQFNLYISYRDTVVVAWSAESPHSTRWPGFDSRRGQIIFIPILKLNVCPLCSVLLSLAVVLTFCWPQIPISRMPALLCKSSVRSNVCAPPTGNRATGIWIVSPGGKFYINLNMQISKCPMCIMLWSKNFKLFL